jgi:hypothetical protein
MPLSLLLQEAVYTFRWGAYHLEPWVHLVRTEELLIDRARSAFLVHWFGSGLPLHGSFVKIVLENIKELSEHYYRVVASLAPNPEGLNLTEPLAGLIGELAGIALSPTTVLLAITLFLRKLPAWLQILGLGLASALALVAPRVALGVAFFPSALGIVIGSLFFPIAILGGLGYAIAHPDDLRKVYALLGSAAMLLVAAGHFLQLLMGPRERITNPLLRDILEIFDRLAGLLPFALALVAVMVTRIGPLLEPLASQVKPFELLIGEVGDTVSFLFADIPATVNRYLPLIFDQIDFVLVQLSLILPVFGIVFTEMFTNLGELLTSLVDKAEASLRKWKADVTVVATGSPIALQLKHARTVFAIAARELSSGTSSSSSSSSTGPSSFPELKLTKPGDFLRSMGGPPPGGFAAIGTLAEIDIRHGGALFGDLITYSKSAREGAAAASRPTNVFGAERQALLYELGAKSPAEALAHLREDQLKLRDLLTSVVGRVLPPALRVEMGNLLDVFRKLDQGLYETKVQKSDYPVRDLPDNGQLVPVVHRLVIRGSGVTRADVDAFQARLQQAMNAQRYPATSPSAPGGLAASKG